MNSDEQSEEKKITEPVFKRLYPMLNEYTRICNWQLTLFDKTQKQNTMNFPQAFLWTALIVMIGIFVFIFYRLIKDQVHVKKDDPDSKSNPSTQPRMTKKDRTPAAIAQCPTAKISQAPASVISPISNIRGSVEVVNITNYTAVPLRYDTICPASSLDNFIPQKMGSLRRLRARPKINSMPGQESPDNKR